MKHKQPSIDVEPPPAAAAPRCLTAYGPTAMVSVAFVLFAGRLFRLISQYAVNIFFSDQWDFNDATLFQEHSLWQMFTWQVGPHRQGLGGLFERLVEPQFSWNSRIESFVVGAVIVAAAVAALWLKERLYGQLSVFDMIIPAIFFIPAQFETLFVTANFAHGPFPLLLIILYCLAWTCRERSVRYTLVLIINFVTIYTGFGIFLGFVTPVLLLLDYRACGPRERLRRVYLLATVAASLLSLGAFFIGYKFNPALDCFSPQPQSIKGYVAYMSIMFANFFAVKVGIVQLFVGLAALIALSAVLMLATWELVRRHKVNSLKASHTIPLIATALTAYCLLFCLSTAYGRLCGGLGTARASRYVIYLELGVFGVYLYLLNIRWVQARKLLLTGLLVAVLAASSYVDRPYMQYFADIKLQWKNCYLATENTDFCNLRVGFPILPNSAEDTHLQEKLEYLKATRQNLYADGR